MRAETGLRTPPHSREAEAAVLGAVLISTESLENALELLSPKDFYDPGHGLIFQAMTDLAREGRPVDHLTVAQRLMAEDQLTRAGGGEYLAGLDQAEPSSALLEHHAGIVRSLSRPPQAHPPGRADYPGRVRSAAGSGLGPGPGLVRFPWIWPKARPATDPRPWPGSRTGP